MQAFHGQGKLDRFIHWANEQAHIDEQDITQVLN
jgi:hypothetical protein